MVLRIDISPDTEARLKQKAERAGLDVPTFAARTLERVAARPSLDETLAPLRAEVEAQGIGEAELSDLLENAKHKLRSERRSRPDR